MKGEFKNDLEFEDRCKKVADNIYRKLGATKIRRWDYQNKEGKDKQLEDIDVTIATKNRVYNASEKFDASGEFKVSEKFRTSDYGDMLIEIKNHPIGDKQNLKDSWGFESKADYYMYFVPGVLHEISTKPLKNYLNDHKKELEELVRGFISSPKYDANIKIRGKHVGGIRFDNKNCSLVSCKSYNESNKQEWMSISICIPWRNINSITTHKEIKVDYTGKY